jgi:hypothetical protein
MSPRALTSGAPLRRADQIQRHGLLDALVVEPPVGAARAVGLGQVAGPPQAVAGDIDRLVGIGRVDVEVADPVAELTAGLGRQAADPGGTAEVVAGLVAQALPGLAAVGAAEHLVAGPPAVEGRDHDHAGMGGIEAEAAIAEQVAAAGLDRGDVGPGPGVGIHLPDRPVGDAVRAQAIAIGDIDRALGVDRQVVGNQALGLAGDQAPAFAAVGADQQGAAAISAGHAGIDDRRLAGRGLQGRVEGHQGDVDLRKGRDPRPGRAMVGAAIEAVLGAQQQHRPGLGIDHQPLAGVAAVLVAADLHRQLGLGPGGAAVGGAQQRPAARIGAGIFAGRHVQPVGIVRIDRQAQRPGQLAVGALEAVVQGHPGACRAVEAIGSADVGADVDQPLLGRVVDHAADEAAAEHLDGFGSCTAAPSAGRRGRARRRPAPRRRRPRRACV